MTKLIKIDETKKFEIVTPEHKQLEKVIQNEKGYPISKAEPKIVKSFLTDLISESFLLAGLKKLNTDDLIITSNALFEGINEKYPLFTNSEIKKAFKNGIGYEYKDRGNYNFALSYGTFMFFLKCYDEDKKKLKNSNVAKSRATQQERQEQENLSQLLLKKHNETYQTEFQLLCKEVEDQIKKRIRVDFSVLDHIEIEAITPFLIKKCNEMDCSLTDEQQEKLLLWVDQHETKSLKYQSRLIFEILMYNLFKKKLNIKDDVLFVIFTKPNQA